MTASTLLGVINTVNDCGCGHDTVPAVTPVSSSLQDVLDDDESQPPCGWSIRRFRSDTDLLNWTLADYCLTIRGHSET